MTKRAEKEQTACRRQSVKMADIVAKMKLEMLTPDIDISGIRIRQSDVNRPAIQLVGFFEHFDPHRIQIIGYVEHSYMLHMSQEEKEKNYAAFLSRGVPCVVFCRDFMPDDTFLRLAGEYRVPLFRTKLATSIFMAELIRWLNVKLAPRISIHGVLVDIFGEGVLITGESGIGKSEAALELIKRGHRLVSDDVVEIRKVSEATLIGTAPDVTRYFIEVRGIGIIDVKELFGVSSVREIANIDLVIRLEDWDKNGEYDRLGLEEEYTEYLGNRVVTIRLPVRPGRNLAVICESAAANHRQKKMGYNATEELYKRVQKQLTSPREED
ncbi:MAG: HPr(Ser) kinase/phosphatase [Lachnospiraceae bacterium]|nr:HPr(Ser) kinase/phosphatase [Lachnospiraceae bacterium]